jgi:hypothetical protein
MRINKRNRSMNTVGSRKGRVKRKVTWKNGRVGGRGRCEHQGWSKRKKK